MYIRGKKREMSIEKTTGKEKSYRGISSSVALTRSSTLVYYRKKKKKKKKQFLI